LCHVDKKDIRIIGTPGISEPWLQREILIAGRSNDLQAIKIIFSAFQIESKSVPGLFIIRQMLKSFMYDLIFQLFIS
jgi:hypothetical protein